MSRSLGVLIGLLAALALLAGTAPTAQAETEDTVRKLDAAYAVQADGTVDVTYRLDWDFGRKGAHGIKLGLVTAERWDADPLKEAVYRISDLKVSSPSGVPTQLESYETDESLELQIGDPDTELDVEQATYVITYTVQGALRTFDGRPQFYWDVTSPDFPPIDDFSVTVTGPSAIPRARCLQGNDECTARVTDGRAILTGSDAQSYNTVTAVAEFAPGSIENAEPTLRERKLYSPALVSSDASVRIGADGVARVTERLRVKTSPLSSEIGWQLPLRRSLTWSKDQLFTVSELRVTLDGAVLPTSREISNAGQPSEDVEIEATLPDSAQQSATVDLVASYSVRGAVVSDGTGPASFAWPISTFDSRDYDLPTSETVDWTLPGPVGRLDCRYRDDVDDPDGRCRVDGRLSSDEASASFSWDGDNGYGPRQWVIIEFPAGSVPRLLPATDSSETVRRLVGAGVMIGSILVFPALGWLLSRIRLGSARDQRYRDVPPGVIGSNREVTTARLRGPIPVRFEPPEASLVQVGLALDRKLTNRHLAATLINMAANGAVRLSSKPLAMWEADRDRLASSFERSLYAYAQPEGSSGELSEADKRGMARQLDGQRKQARKQADLLRSIPLRSSTTLLWAAAPVLAVAAGAALAISSGAIGWLLAAIGIAVLLLVGIGFGFARRRYALTAKATAYAEQAKGFREYLRSAEKGQLNFEADADIYRRYLPWAVLFNEVRRWTKACQQLAADGRIDAPDTSFIAGLSVGSLSHDLRGLTSSVSPTPTSSGGSGGSSGFSGGASGGGGGGGTSASSW